MAILKKMAENTTSSLPKTQSAPVRTESSLWNAFEQVLLFISLYVLATSVSLIIHALIDKWLPGVSADGSGYDGSPFGWLLLYLFGGSSLDNGNIQDALLRGYLSALFVSLPIFDWLFLDIAKRTLKAPEIASQRSRKILVYITLVLTFFIMLFNLISLINSLLNGNVTINFVLHFLDTVGISGLIFAYYLFQVKTDRNIHA